MGQIKKMFVEFRSIFSSEDVLKENETHANVVVATTMLNLFIVILVSWILNRIGIIQTEAINMTRFLIFSSITLGIPATICFIFKGKKKWLKYVLLIAFIITLSNVDKNMTYITSLLMVIPVILSARYYSKKFTINIATVTMLAFVISAFISGVNYLVKLNELITVILLYYVIVFASVQISRSGKNMIERQQEITKKGARIETELNLANAIQSNMLPSIFPPFPEHEEIDIYAKMIPAKEVGGDFYDMFLIDDNHLAIAMADVSGKGVPASLFMMISKILIKNISSIEKEVDNVFYRVNNMLCDGNKIGLFVTAWLGVLDLRNGQLEFVNAGHNPPLVYSNKIGEFEYLKTKPNMVLAGLENIKYEKHKVQIEPGDKIFLYTDGVVEATNLKKELYGEQRLKDFLNRNLNLTTKDTVEKLKKDIDEFVGDPEQFDDITMLEFIYKKSKNDKNVKEQKEFKADVSELPKVQEFVEKELEENNCDMKTINQIILCVEEIFVNIANYAYKEKTGICRLAISFEEKDKFEMIFEDNGIPFNPLEKKDSDITAPLQDRQIGGLGILLVKKTMDSIEYKYENQKNILILRKNI